MTEFHIYSFSGFGSAMKNQSVRSGWVRAVILYLEITSRPIFKHLCNCLFHFVYLYGTFNFEFKLF